METSITPQVSSELPGALKAFLLELRQEPRFLQVLQAYQRTRLPAWRRPSASKAPPDLNSQMYDWVFKSGKLEAERQLMFFLTGKDGDDRQTD